MLKSSLEPTCFLLRKKERKKKDDYDEWIEPVVTLNSICQENVILFIIS